jgi:hypothetical protein
MKTRFTTYHNPEVWQEPRYADTASGKWYRARERPADGFRVSILIERPNHIARSGRTWADASRCCLPVPSARN